MSDYKVECAKIRTTHYVPAIIVNETLRVDRRTDARLFVIGRLLTYNGNLANTTIH